MKLTWIDAATTVLAAVAVAVMLALTLGWSWPLLVDYRAGAIALGVIGIAMCPLSWTGLRAAFGDGTAREALQNRLGLGGPYYTVMSALAFVAVVLIAWGIVAPGQAVFLALGVVVVGMWLIATGRHALAVPFPPRSPLSA